MMIYIGILYSKGGFPLIENAPWTGMEKKISRRKEQKIFPLLISTFLRGQERKTVFYQHGRPKYDNDETTTTSKSNESEEAQRKCG